MIPIDVGRDEESFEIFLDYESQTPLADTEEFGGDNMNRRCCQGSY